METEIDAVSLYKPAFGLVKKPFTQAQKLALITFVHSPIGDDLDDCFDATGQGHDLPPHGVEDAPVCDDHRRRARRPRAPGPRRPAWAVHPGHDQQDEDPRS